jgi:hypothetical protein
MIRRDADTGATYGHACGWMVAQSIAAVVRTVEKVVMALRIYLNTR